MTDWLECLNDARAIRAVFGTHTPDLQGITVKRMSVNLQEACVELGFDLPEFPADPPVKWRHFTTVALQIRLYELSDLHIDGLPAHDVADCSIQPDGEQFRTSVLSASVEASFRSRWIDVGKISAYQQIPETPAPPADPDHRCRICGFDLGEPARGPDGRSPGYLICSCCGAESGLDDVDRRSARRYRSRWLAQGTPWFAPKDQPPGWTLRTQMSEIPRDYI